MGFRAWACALVAASVTLASIASADPSVVFTKDEIAVINEVLRASTRWIPVPGNRRRARAAARHRRYRASSLRSRARYQAAAARRHFVVGDDATVHRNQQAALGHQAKAISRQCAPGTTSGW